MLFCIFVGEFGVPSWTPQLPSNIPQVPTIKGHKDSIKGPLGGPGCSFCILFVLRFVGLLDASGFRGFGASGSDDGTLRA